MLLFLIRRRGRYLVRNRQLCTISGYVCIDLYIKPLASTNRVERQYNAG